MRVIFLLLCLIPTLHAKNMVFSAVENSLFTEVSRLICTEAYAQMGVTIQIQETSALRALMMSNSGNVDGELIRIQGIETKYPNLIQIPIPIYRIEASAFSRNPDITIKGMESLRPYKVAYRRGIRAAEKAIKKIKGLRTQVVDRDRQLMDLLQLGRVDISIMDKLVGTQLATQLGYSDIRALEPVLQTFLLYHYLNKKHTALVPKLTAILKKMQQKGLIEKIRQDSVHQLFQK